MSRFRSVVIGGLCFLAGSVIGRGDTRQISESELQEDSLGRIKLEMKVLELEDMGTYQQNCAESTALYIQELQKYIHELREENIKSEVREYFWQKELERKYPKPTPVKVDTVSL